MQEPQDNLCSFCQKSFDHDDRQNRPIYAKDKLKFHPICRMRIDDIKKTLEEVKELNENIEEWVNKHPNYKFESEYR